MLELREAKKEDAQLIAQYTRELAEFEKLAHECRADPQLIAKWLFNDTPIAKCLLVEWDGKPAGFAMYFYNFSTFLSQPGIYIEDIFVRPDFRRKGIARTIFKHLAQKAVAEGCGRLEWSVLDWNSDAIASYKSFGAKSLDGWLIQRVAGDSLKKLAG